MPEMFVGKMLLDQKTWSQILNKKIKISHFFSKLDFRAKKLFDILNSAKQQHVLLSFDKKYCVEILNTSYELFTFKFQLRCLISNAISTFSVNFLYLRHCNVKNVRKIILRHF